MPTDAVGRIQEVFHCDHEAKFDWIVSDFVSLYGCQSLCPPNFRYFGIDMHFKIVIALDSTMCVLRAIGADEITASIFVSVGLKMADGREEVLFRDGRFAKKNGIWSLIEFLDLAVLHQVRSCLLCDGKVTITIREIISRERQTENSSGAGCKTDRLVHPDLEDVSVLLEHFKDLLLTGNDHDLIIKVKNKQFKAHKCVLRARSPVFEAMLRNKMKESSEGTVSIDDCDPEVFGQFLRYVYIAELDIQSVSQAVGLYYACDKYDLPLLKKKVIPFLMTSFSSTTITDVITLAATHSEEELMQKAIVYFSMRIEEIMLTVEWQRFLVNNPIQANEINLKAVQCLKASYTRNK